MITQYSREQQWRYMYMRATRRSQIRRHKMNLTMQKEKSLSPTFIIIMGERFLHREPYRPREREIFAEAHRK